MGKKKDCEHHFKTLRESRPASFGGQGVNTIVQCRKCLKLYEISDIDNSFKEIKPDVQRRNHEEEMRF